MHGKGLRQLHLLVCNSMLWCNKRRAGGGEGGGGDENPVLGLSLGDVDVLSVPDGGGAVGKAALEGLKRSLGRFRSGTVAGGCLSLSFRSVLLVRSAGIA